MRWTISRYSQNFSGFDFTKKNFFFNFALQFIYFITGVANLDFNKSLRRSDLSALAFNAYCGLQKLCNRIHGPVHDSCVQISRFLLPGLLMTHRGSSEITPKGLGVIRDHALHFVKHLMASVSI